MHNPFKLDLRNVLTESSLCEILDLPERLAEELGKSFVVAFDEFQEVAEISREFALEKDFGVMFDNIFQPVVGKSSRG